MELIIRIMGKVKENELRMIVKQELLREMFGGEGHVIPSEESLRNRIADFAVTNNVHPKAVVRQLIKDVSRTVSKRRSPWSRTPEFKKLVSMSRLNGRNAISYLTSLIDFFVRNDPTNPENIERDMAFKGTGVGS